jgi:hypothetical protein
MAIIESRPPPCSQCHALGDFDHEGTRHQLYYCLLRLHSIPIVDPDWPTVLARWGAGPDEFRHGIGLADSEPALAEALRRAIDRRLYDPEKPLHPGMQRVMAALTDAILADLRKSGLLP